VLSFITNRNTSLLGIDISSSAVKVLELSLNGTRYCVEGYGFAPLSSDIIATGGVKNLEAVGKAVSLAVSRSGSRLRDAAIAVGGSSVITKVVQFPADMSDEEMEAQARLEAGKHVPYPIEEVSLDFEVLGLVPDNEKQVNVLLAASRTENVERCVGILSLADINTKVVDVEPYAIERACQLLTYQLPEQGKDKVIAVIDIGAVMTTITVLYNFNVIYTREEIFGGRQLTEAIQQHYDVTMEEARTIKLQSTFPEGYEEDVLAPFCGALLPLIQRSLQLFFSSSRFNAIDHILFAGGSSLIPGLQELVKQRLGANSELVDLFADMDISPNVDVAALQKDGPSLMICCGLALRSFAQ
jgi:type IV pilus assembly protein PilM